MNSITIKGRRRNSLLENRTMKVDSSQLIIDDYPLEIVVLSPNEVLGIIPHSTSFGQAIKIIHKNYKYDLGIIFISYSEPELVIQKILATGFKTLDIKNFDEEDKRIWTKENDKGYPLKFSALIPFFTVLPICYLFNELYYSSYKNHSIASILISVLLFGIIFLTLSNISEKFRKLIVKEGFDFENVRLFTLLLLLGLIVFLIFVIFQILYQNN